MLMGMPGRTGTNCLGIGPAVTFRDHNIVNKARTMELGPQAPAIGRAAWASRLDFGAPQLRLAAICGVDLLRTAPSPSHY